VAVKAKDGRKRREKVKDERLKPEGNNRGKGERGKVKARS
jgi:hypothetical protein